jgi:hypothetical protein
MTGIPGTPSPGDRPDQEPVLSARELQEELEAARRAGHAIPYETLAALAAAIGDLRRKVRYVESVVDRSGLAFAKDTRALVTRLTAELDTLAGKVEDLAQTVDALHSRGDRVAAPNWVGLPETERAAELAKLAEWVTRVLVPSYRPDPPLTPCWRQHWPVIWELSTVWAEWRRIYDRRSPELTGALEWHNRYLPGALHRPRRELAHCTGRQCALAAQGPQRHT